MTGIATVQDLRQQLLQIRSLADRDVRALADAVADLSPRRARETLIQVLPDLAAPFSAGAEELSAVAFEDLRAEARRGVFYAETVSGIPEHERVVKASRWAVDPLRVENLDSTVFSRLSGIVTKWIMDASRDTIELNADREAVGYQRMPRPGCCAWCAMLASRGADYWTEASANAGSHDDCRCVVMPVYLGTEMAELANATADDYEARYRSSLRDADGGRLTRPKEILARYRELYSVA